jgi:cytolysin-activating lysine-acyltransferase
MSVLVDTQGQELPPVEAPGAEKLRVYGDLLFLAFRSKRHRTMNVATLRSYIEPAVELGQFRIFRFDDVPRGMYTWAHLNPDTERKLIEGRPLAPEDWNSGPRLWIVDMIAPYRGLMSGIARWIMVPGNFSDTEFLFRRVAGTNRTRRIVHVDFTAKRLARIYSAPDFLASL